MFKRKSTWERLSEPVVKAADSGPARSGLAAVATAVGATVVSAAISAVRNRREA